MSDFIFALLTIIGLTLICGAVTGFATRNEEAATQHYQTKCIYHPALKFTICS